MILAVPGLVQPDDYIVSNLFRVCDCYRGFLTRDTGNSEASLLIVELEPGVPPVDSHRIDFHIHGVERKRALCPSNLHAHYPIDRRAFEVNVEVKFV